jgi:dTDP-4-amino-4,6-dideoxygalactose transaminase
LKYVQDLFGKDKLPVTDELSERILSLPLYPGMDENQVKRVIEAVREILT